MEAVELLHQLNLELRQGYSPRFSLEVGLIRLLRILDSVKSGMPDERPAPAAGPGLKAVGAEPSRKIEGAVSDKREIPPGDLDKQKEKLASARKVTGEGTRGEEKAPVVWGQGEAPQPDSLQETRERKLGAAEEQWISTIKQRWSELLAEAGKTQKSTGALLAQATLTGCRGNCILFSFKAGQAVLSERIMEAGHRRIIEKVLSRLLAAPVRIDVDLYNRETQETKGEPVDKEVPVSSGWEEPGVVGEADLVEEAARIFNGKIFEVKKREG